MSPLGSCLLLIPALWLCSEATSSNILLRQSRGHGGRLGLDAEESPSIDGQSTMKRLFPWYHTTSELSAHARHMAQHCGGALEVRSVSEDGVHIDVATVKAKGSNPTNKVFILFGEHSRELISPESGLYLLRVLCGLATSDSSKSAEETLKDNEFQLVLNGNPRSRRDVEQGAFCTRTNPAGVDLNRNWDDMWEDGNVGLSQNPGPYPFSEPETRIFRRLVTEYRPTTFLTVHSGTRGLYMPWAYDRTHLATRNQAAMMRVLRNVDQDHCQCPFGAAGKEVGYSCPGTCLDWAYDKLKTPYSFAFEIYTSPDMDESLQSRWKEKLDAGGASLLEEGNHLAHEHFLDLFHQHGSDFVQARHSLGAGNVEQDPFISCFSQFNPDTAERFNTTLRNWAGAYLEMSNLIAADMREQGAALTQGNATAAPARGL